MRTDEHIHHAKAHAEHADEHNGDADHGGHGEHSGHGGHGDHAAQFRRKFWLSLILAVPVVFTSHMVAGFLGYHVPPWLSWVAPVLGTAIFLYGGWPFLSGAASELRGRKPGMMTLIALAIGVAFVASGLTTFGIGGLDLDFWWELALLVVIMLLGHWLEMRALGQASGALDALAALLPDTADRVSPDGSIHAVPVGELVDGDTVLVRPGGRVPADGVVTTGEAELDESMVTGESRPVVRRVNDRVVAGTVVTDTAIRVRVTAIGENTVLAGIRRLVEQAQQSRSKAQALADRVAGWLFYFSTAVGIVTFAVWLLLGDPNSAVERTVTVLVIACPHALGLAIPLVIAISTAKAAKAGILVKDRLALERMRTVDAVLFDKTGTLTNGTPSVTDVESAESGAVDRLLALAGAAESESEHPLAKAIVAAAAERGEIPAATDVRSMTGRGIQARVDGHEVAIGGPALLRQREAEIPPALADRTAAWVDRGAIVLHVMVDGSVAGAIALADTVRPESAATVASLRSQGIRTVMITGDAQQVADTVAGQVGVDEVFAEVLPENKESAVSELQHRGLKVAMVGDGVNDAPALARADVGIAIGAGTDVAIESAGVVLASDDPNGVLAVRRLSAASYRKMIQNLVWATGYNLLSVPLAAGVLAPIGFILPPAVGAIAMSLSTIIVALNAQLLRRVDLRPQRP